MSMTTWAEKEIELACAREKAVSQEEGEWEYGCACYESALKALKSLMEDGHSGYSIGITKSILCRLIDGKCLTPIEDTPDVWEHPACLGEDPLYQCSRMSSLFKMVSKDGSVSFSDTDRVRCADVDNPDVEYTTGIVRQVIDEMFPITMPYWPSGYFKVFCEDFLTDRSNGDFDTVGIISAITPEGKLVDICRYFKEDNGKMKEISLEEYTERKKLAESLQSKPDCDDSDHDVSGLTEEE